MRRKIMALAAALALSAAACGALGAQPRIVTITSARAFGPLSRPAVVFPHELHVSLDDMRCASCHHHTGGAASSIRCAGCHVGRLEIRNAFHRLCIGCHDGAQTRGEPTGPRTCGGCHPLVGVRQPSATTRPPSVDIGRPRDGGTEGPQGN